MRKDFTFLSTIIYPFFLALSACGGDSDKPDESSNPATTISGDFLRFGFLEIVSGSINGSGSYFATFSSVTEPLPSEYINELLDPPLDFCEVEIFVNGNGESSTDSVIDDLNPRSISAGEVIVLSSAEGTFRELPREIEGDAIFYSSEDFEVTTPLPSGLTANIPGDDFPAYPNVAIPDIETLNVTAPLAGEIVVPSTVFSWDADPDPRSSIIIQLLGSNDADSVDVYCRVADDGQFIFPEEIRMQLGENFNAERSVFVDRLMVDFEQVGDSLLTVLVYSEGLYY